METQSKRWQRSSPLIGALSLLAAIALIVGAHEPTTTTNKPRPTTTTEPKTIYIDERNDGDVVHL